MTLMYTVGERMLKECAHDPNGFEVCFFFIDIEDSMLIEAPRFDFNPIYCNRLMEKFHKASYGLRQLPSLW
jgi:hypothetical protein